MFKYKFSVITCMYKAEKYLRPAIDSIINQDIGFEENIQLILVNDGSPDNCDVICKEYQKKYPNNIVYLEKENGGLASAKNFGLNHVEGEYVNFFDSDDILPKNTFREVYNFFNRNDLCVDLVTIPLVFFGVKTGLHPKYEFMGNTNRTINLLEEPFNFVLSNAASFYKNEIIKNMRYDESFLGEEDTLINGLIYLKNPRIGYVCERGVQYNYRKDVSHSSIVDTSSTKPESYKTVIKLLDRIIDKNNIKDYQKELIIYELRSRFQKIDPSLFKTDEEYNNILKEYKRFVKLLDANFVLKESKYCDSAKMKKFLLNIIDDKNDVNYEQDIFNDLQTATIRLFNVDKNIAHIDVTYTKIGNDNLKLYIFDEKNKTYTSYEEKEFDGPFNEQVGETIIDLSHVARFDIDLNKVKQIKLILKDEKTGIYYPLRKMYTSPKISFRAAVKRIRFGNYIIRQKRRVFTVQKSANSAFNRFKEKMYGMIAILGKRHYFAFSRLFARNNKKYILVNDRSTKGGDNGEALFKYIVKNEPEMAKKTYFVIQKSCPDYKRIKQYGKVVGLGSLKHKILFLNAKWIYSSHMMYEFYNPFPNPKYLYFIDLVRSKFVWLQHGITMNDISAAANKYNKKNDYIISCTNDEYEEFKRDKYSFDEKDIILSGFARYDLLENNPKNIISIAPTWRRGLGVLWRNNNSDKQQLLDSFNNTEYYQMYKKMLTNKDLLNKCRDKKITIQLALHPEMMNYVELFDVFDNDVVKVVHSDDLVYKDMFEQSKLLVTDYSSVFFDFSYLKKPIVYFQFDEKQFFQSHYKKGYFDYRKDGLGPVITDCNEAIKKIIDYIDKDFKIEDEYLKRIEKTYKFHDKNNSKRIIDNTYKKDR